MNGVAEVVSRGVGAKAGSSGNSESHSGGRTVIGMLLTACLVSSLFSLRDASATALTVSAGRPSLVFSSYLIDDSHIPVRPQPIMTPHFLFKNKGIETVRITELIPSCGCLSPVAVPMEIPPGGTGRLTLPIRTRNESAGLHEYMVTVRYQDSRPREAALTYKVILPEKQIEIEPRVLMVMGRISSGDRDIISISDHRSERLSAPFRITDVQSSTSIFSAQLAGASTVDGVSRHAIEVSYSESIPLGQHRGVITVRTDDDVYPVLQIPVILGDRRRPADEQVSVSPDTARVIIESSHPDQSEGGVVTFNIPSKWKVSHVETYPPQLAAKVVETEQSTPERALIKVELSLKELPARGIEQGNLTLYATDGDEAEMVTTPVTLSWK